MTESLIELLDKHIAMPADDDHQRGWRRACEFIKDKICSGQLSSEILDNGGAESDSSSTGLQGEIPENRLNEPTPPASHQPVSLEKCAIAAGEVLQDAFSNKARPVKDVAKAVLDAAGVPYVA